VQSATELLGSIVPGYHSAPGPSQPHVFVLLICGAGLATASGPLLAADGGLLPSAVGLEFVLFVLTLIGIALFHRRTLEIAFPPSSTTSR
jgi:hypothetical protein